MSPLVATPPCWGQSHCLCQAFPQPTVGCFVLVLPPVDFACCVNLQGAAAYAAAPLLAAAAAQPTQPSRLRLLMMPVLPPHSPGVVLSPFRFCGQGGKSRIHGPQSHSQEWLSTGLLSSSTRSFLLRPPRSSCSSPLYSPQI